MSFKVNVKKEAEVTTLDVSAGVRYWEDGIVNGVEDTEGKLIPCRKGDMWAPVIDLQTGVIQDWPAGVKADIHYKVCDAGVYILRDAEGNEVTKKEGYVPAMLSPGGDGYGDYIIMTVDGNGQIENWEVDLEEFEED